MGVGFFAIFMSYVNFLLTQDDSIEELTEVYHDTWATMMGKIEKANAHKMMHGDYIKETNDYFTERFRFCYNEVEHSEFYVQLKPVLQKKVCDFVFKKFYAKFEDFFIGTSLSFRREIAKKLHFKQYSSFRPA